MCRRNSPAKWSTWLAARKGEIDRGKPKAKCSNLEFEIPSRVDWLAWYNAHCLPPGEAVMAHRFKGIQSLKGFIPGRNNGVLLSKNTEKQPVTLSIKLQDRVLSSLIQVKMFTPDRSLQRISNPVNLIVNANWRQSSLSTIAMPAVWWCYSALSKTLMTPGRMYGIHPVGWVSR